MCVHANAKTNKVVNTPAGFRVDVTYSLSTPQGISEVCNHVINLSPVQQGPDVVSSLEFSASLYRLPSKIDSAAMRGMSDFSPSSCATAPPFGHIDQKTIAFTENKHFKAIG
ncbi:hypothetical protein NQZ68_001442 [Dissostichus eleginoides]|nr:hypothetical protein NQZ68_001442 [Dissostichus eleginoides]